MVASDKQISALLDDPAVDPRTLVEGLTARSGTDFQGWLVAFLRRTLQADYVFVGELRGEGWNEVGTLAFATPDGPGASFQYDLDETPCAEVIERKVCNYPRDVRRLFPNDEMLAEMGAESYLGLSLFDVSGRSLGLLAVLGRESRDEAWTRRALAVLELFRPRVETELTLRRDRRDLETLVQGASSREPLAEIVCHLAHSMHVKAAFVSVFVDEARSRMKALAMCVDGELQNEMGYGLGGTPCATVTGTEPVFYPRRLRELFPTFDLLAELGAESYFAVPLIDSAGEALGHLGVMHDRPLQDSFRSERLFRVFAARVASEIERTRAEERRQELERKMLERQRMESLGNLAGGIAHDFNNVLSSILLYGDLVLARLPAGTQQHEHVSEMIAAAKKAGTLSRQILTYSGRGSIVPRPLELVPLVRDMADLLRVNVSKKCRLEYRMSTEPVILDADAEQVRQVILNLVTNASEAIGTDEGTIVVAVEAREWTSLEIEKVRFGADLPAGKYASLRVADDGCGIDASMLEQLFDPFFSTQSQGRGLGLASVLGIVRGHGGAIDIESRPGRGSTFTVLLPLAERPLEEDEPVAVLAPGSLAGRILVVDDEAGVRRSLRMVLRQAGFEVLAADDGEEAVKVYDREGKTVDLVLLDLNMPRMGGSEAFDELLRLNADVGVLLITGLIEKRELASFQKRGLIDVIYKPFEADTVVQQVRRALLQRL